MTLEDMKFFILKELVDVSAEDLLIMDLAEIRGIYEELKGVAIAQPELGQGMRDQENKNNDNEQNPLNPQMDHMQERRKGEDESIKRVEDLK